VTQALLAESVNGSKIVRIGPKAIVTPSALDFVRQRGIEIVREPSAAMANTAARWLAIVTTSHLHIAPAIDGLQQYGIQCELRLSGLPTEAAAQATSDICRGDADKVIVFTGEPELVACLANRNERIRAAAIGDAAALARTQRELKPNVLALDPSNKSVHELRTLLKAF
jgi:ribose 5-phosphate isomerase RpiB